MFSIAIILKLAETRFFVLTQELWIIIVQIIGVASPMFLQFVAYILLCFHNLTWLSGNQDYH